MYKIDWDNTNIFTDNYYNIKCIGKTFRREGNFMITKYYFICHGRKHEIVENINLGNNIWNIDIHDVTNFVLNDNDQYYLFSGKERERDLQMKAIEEFKDDSFYKNGFYLLKDKKTFCGNPCGGILDIWQYKYCNKKDLFERLEVYNEETN